jgi:prolyl-tRNA editing enzyme YbaK/EbsC (Cys-tRNA(Pro) deacylase)
VIDPLHPGIRSMVEVASRKGVALDIRSMPHAVRSAEETAAAVHAELGQIVKSLLFVARRPGGRFVPIVCLVSGRNQVDLSLLAAVSGEVAIRQATATEARDLTGYSIGGIPPFGHGRDVRILMDQDLSQYQWVWAAAGTDRDVFRVAPKTLQMLSNALVAPVAETSWVGAVAGFRIEPQRQFAAGTGA